MTSKNFALSAGRALGETAAMAKHVGISAFRTTGKAGKDFVQGTKTGYAEQDAKLAAARRIWMERNAPSQVAQAISPRDEEVVHVINPTTAVVA